MSEYPCNVLQVDVVSPNATGGVLNAKTIPTIRAPLICGAANNQLADDKTDDGRIAARGLLYVPDFLANRMGIVTCADEGAGTLSPDPMIERHYGTEWPHKASAAGRSRRRSRKRSNTTSRGTRACRVSFSGDTSCVWTPWR